MPNDRFDSGHVVIPVRHPNGETHNIAVPEDTSLSDLHDALVDSDYAHTGLAPQQQPTAEGAIENSLEFKKNATELWNAAKNGQLRGEAGDFLTRRGSYTKPVVTQDTSDGTGRITFDKPADTMAVVHTHPRTGGLSPRDIQTAKDHKMVVYAIDTDGLHPVGPDGKVTEVYRSAGDLMDKKKKAEVRK